MSIDDTNLLLKALREVGVTIPDAQPISVRGQPISVPVRRYWHVFYQGFETVVDYRDATSQESAIKVALSGLQPWYVTQCLPLEEQPRANEMNHNNYVEWLKEHH